jgi:hypothetical protein
MVKYGKLFRELQIKEFKGNYIDYKKLKQKIKKMRQTFPRTSQDIITRQQRTSNSASLKLYLRSSLGDEDKSRSSSTSTTYYDRYGTEFKEFKELLDTEFQRCYKHFKAIKKQLHNKINKHLYTQTNYSSYNIDDIIKEIKNLRSTMYLAKCLNAFIHDNMMAMKKILKKFDKKFYNYFGNLGPIYILDNLCMHNSDLEYLLQFKIIDETSCIIEGNVKSLRDYYLELVNSNGNRNINRNDFFRIYNEILGYIKDIDELIYFKIQYKEWFYFRKKDTLITNKSSLLKNIMFNPIIFSAYHKDDLMHKFLSRDEQIKDIEEMQIPLSVNNKINIILIIIHSFFYNSLISEIYPLIFLVIRKINKEHVNYTLLIIASTYCSYYFSIMLYHYFGIHRIKCSYIFSYALFFIGSLLYILSIQAFEDENQKEKYAIGFLLGSRICIGLGTNPTLGKNYILTYASKYYLPSISKYYVLFSILGHAFGPFIGFILYDKNKEYTEITQEDSFFNLKYVFYTNYNCMGWYGFIFSFIFGLLYIIFFTSPNSSKFHISKKKGSKKYKGRNSRETRFLDDDYEDSQDKEFYKLQKATKKKEALETIIEEDNSSINSSKVNSNLIKKHISQENNNNSFDEDALFQKSNTLIDKEKNLDINIFGSKYEVNPLLIFNENNKAENLLESNNSNGNFVNINMIPRTIEDLIRKEKTKLSYLNRNLLMILTILFFDNLLKENFIAYCSYYTTKYFTASDFQLLFEPKYFCCLICGSYLLELISMLFILPFYKLNTKIKKLLVILMSLTIVLMVPLSLEIDLFYYFIIISVIIIISSIIEVLSSCYLAYLTPPEWKFCHINAGVLPLYIMSFGKLIGCLICLTSLTNITLLNNHVVMGFTFIGYGITGFYIIKSKNFRIKAIARIMRKAELQTYAY